MCEKPNRNGQPGYAWNTPETGVHPINAPETPERCEIVYDEPGRCCPTLNGKPYHIDHHSRHYRLFKDDIGQFRAVVRHGGGTVEFGNDYDWGRIAKIMEPMDSDTRFILFMSIESLCKHAERDAVSQEAHRWRAAIADGRARKRRYPKRGTTRVWIEDGPRVYDVSA